MPGGNKPYLDLIATQAIKQMTNAAQILLSNGFAGALLLFAAVWIAARTFGAAWSGVLFVLKKVLPPLKWSTAFWLCFGSCILWAFSTPLSDFIQEVEQRYLSPVYVGDYTPDSTGIIEIYERQIAEHCTGNQFNIVRDSTRAIAARIGSTPRAIYETALLECGLKWWRVRDDQVAAGWIQFTNAGLKGLGVSKQQVINACNSRSDAACSFIMALTGQYLARKAERMKEGATLLNTIDLYLAVFAPAHIGKVPDAVVYAGFNNPAYYKNSGLDGWWIESGKILRSKSARDGKITIFEIWCALESKRARLVKK